MTASPSLSDPYTIDGEATSGSERRPSLRDLFSRRYGISTDVGHLGREALPALEPLLSHRSVRRYLPVALAAGTIELLVAAAQSASSSSNLQLWSVIDVRDPERRRALSEVAGSQAHIEQAPAFLVWVADLHRPTELATASSIGHEGLSYLEMFLMACIDTALAAQNAVVAAEALGLGVVYIGALRNDAERVAHILGLPARSFAVFGLCVGWPDPDAAGTVKPRLPQAVVLHRDTYGSVSEQRSTLDDYDSRMAEFYAEQRMNAPEGGWSVHSSQRVASAAALRGRDRLRAALNALGFELR